MKGILLPFLLFMTFSAISQEKKDPTVGLVLSGGGAKGLAHIGALKAIEEAGVEIDYIGGTSMGAIVGGLYAAGYSPKQLDSIFHATNFEVLIQDELPRKAKTFYGREYDERYAISLPFDDFQISFPSGLSKGQNLYNLLSRLMHHLEGENDFRELEIPFFCVAADIESGEEVILDQGSLPQAISASAAIPTLFRPVEVDGRLFTDGGVFNNYPVEELKKRGADIIIGVDVQDTLRGREELGSVFEILTQISNFSTIHAMRKKRQETDVYIAPPIEGFNLMSFDLGRKIIDVGEKAAREKHAELKEIADLQILSGIEKERVPKIDSLHIVDVRIEGDNSYPKEYILGQLHLRYPSTISYQDLNFGINNLSATGNFDRINYDLIPIKESFVLRLQLEEGHNKTLLRMGVHYDDFYKSGALVNLTHKGLLFGNDHISFDVVLGDNFRYYLDYFWDKGFNWSVGFNSGFRGFEKNIGISFAENFVETEDLEVNSISLDFSEFVNQLYFETVFEKKFAVRMGAEYKYLDVFSETLSGGESENLPSIVFDRSSYAGLFGSLKLDTYDNKYFPSRGSYFQGDFHAYLYSSDYHGDFERFSIAKGKLGHVVSIFPKLAARISGEAGMRIGGNTNNVFNFFLGGYGNNFKNTIVPFYGYDFLDLSADSFAKGLLEVDYEFLNKNHLVLGANMAVVGDDLYQGFQSFSQPLYSGYSVGYGLETFIGPLEAKYSFSPDTQRSHWFFSLGFWF